MLSVSGTTACAARLVSRTAQIIAAVTHIFFMIDPYAAVDKSIGLLQNSM